ncbi:MAG: hypothetical protein ABF821_12075 [Gluconacetobacter sp.]
MGQRGRSVVLRRYADYGCSQGTLESMGNWASDYEDFLPREKRAPFDLEGFTASGLDIARALKTELPDWSIIYCDEFKWQYQNELGLTPAECEYEV